jgi:hypothetical protein
MKARWMLAIALAMFIARGAHATDVGAKRTATPTEDAPAAGQSAPPKRKAQIWPTVTQAQSEAEYPEQWKAQRRAEAAIAANSWVLKVPHVKGMMPSLVLYKNLPNPLTNEDIPRGIGETGIRVWVDEPQNVREVEGHVPSQLSGVPVVIEANPTDFILY